MLFLKGNNNNYCLLWLIMSWGTGGFELLTSHPHYSPVSNPPSPLYLELIGVSLSLHIIIVFSKQVICHSSNNVSRTRRQYDLTNFSPCFISFIISGLSKKGVGRPVDTQSWQEIM